MWLFDKLMNRKIEGKSSLDNVEPLLEKVEVTESDNAIGVKLPDDVNVQGKRLGIDSYHQPSSVEEVYSHIDYKEAGFEVVSGSAVDSTHLTSNGLHHSYVVEDDNNPIHNVVDIGDDGNDGGAYVNVVDEINHATSAISPSIINLTGNDAYLKLTDGDKSALLKSNSLEFSDGVDGCTIAYDKVDDEVKSNKPFYAPKIVEGGDTNLIDLSSYINSGFAKSHTLYAKLLVKHNVMHIIISGKFVAGDSAGGNNVILNNFINAIPEGLRNKIFRADGTDLTQIPSAEQYASFVCATNLIKAVSGSISGNSSGLLVSYSQDNVGLSGYSFGTIAEDTSCFIDFRLSLTL